VAYLGTIPGWQSEGKGAVHAVAMANAASSVPDWAVMLWQDNRITSGAIDANAKNVRYEVVCEASPAVYAQPEQATQAADGLRIEVLRTDGTVLQSAMVSPGAWSGSMQFRQQSVAYSGDGSGAVRLRFGPDGEQRRGRFQGAVRKITLRAIAGR
jgi:hypothetical protein